MESVVLVEPRSVDRRLLELGLTREQLIEVVEACVAARGGCTENDPPSAKGIETWRIGTRRFREILRPLGWEKDDTANFSTVVNHQLRIRVAVLNADDGAGDPGRNPRARSRKGANAERVADRNSQLSFLFMDVQQLEAEVEKGNFSEYATWYFVLYIEDERVRAELSLPVRFSTGNFTDWKERIIFIQSGEWNGVNIRSDDLGPEFEVDVSRKS